MGRTHRASQVRGPRAPRGKAPVGTHPEATVVDTGPSAESSRSHPECPRWVRSAGRSVPEGRGCGQLCSCLPAQPASPPLPLTPHRETPCCSWQQESAVIYFPAQLSSTPLLVFAAGTALGAGGEPHMQTLMCHCVSPVPRQGAPGSWDALEHPSLGGNKFLAKSPSSCSCQDNNVRRHSLCLRLGPAAPGQGFLPCFFKGA